MPTLAKNEITGIIQDNTNNFIIPVKSLTPDQRSKILNAMNEDMFAKTRYTVYDEIMFNEQYNRDMVMPKRLFTLNTKGDDHFEAPVGLIGNVQKIFEKYSDLKLRIEDQRTDRPKYPFDLVGLKLYDYQDPIVKSAIKEKNGLVVVGTGGGKTTISGSLIGEIGQDALFIVPTVSLLSATYDDLKKIVPSNVNIGQIGGNKNTFQDHKNEVDINILSLPLAKRVFNNQSVNPEVKQDIKRAYNMSNTLIVDEAHMVASESAKKVVEESNAKYRIGLTATPYTKHGDIDLQSLFGDKIGNLGAKKLIELKKLTPPEIYRINNDDINPKNDSEILQRLNSSYCHITPSSYMYKQIKSQTLPSSKNKTRNQYIHKGMIECNDARNSRVADLVERLTDNNKTTLVFVNTDEHGQKVLKELDQRNLNGTLLTAKTEKKIQLTDEEKQKGFLVKRQAIFNRVKDDKIKILISTPKLMGTGVSINGIDAVIFADGSKNRVDAVQMVGRAMRTKQGKTKALIFDFIDTGYKFADYMFKWGEERKIVWKKEEYPIFDIKYDAVNAFLPYK